MIDGLGLGLTDSGQACEIGPAGHGASRVLHLHHDVREKWQPREVCLFKLKSRG